MLAAALHGMNCKECLQLCRWTNSRLCHALMVICQLLTLNYNLHLGLSLSIFPRCQLLLEIKYGHVWHHFYSDRLPIQLYHWDLHRHCKACEAWCV